MRLNCPKRIGASRTSCVKTIVAGYQHVYTIVFNVPIAHVISRAPALQDLHWVSLRFLIHLGFMQVEGWSFLILMDESKDTWRKSVCGLRGFFRKPFRQFNRYWLCLISWAWHILPLCVCVCDIHFVSSFQLWRWFWNESPHASNWLWRTVRLWSFKSYGYFRCSWYSIERIFGQNVLFGLLHSVANVWFLQSFPDIRGAIVSWKDNFLVGFSNPLCSNG